MPGSDTARKAALAGTALAAVLAMVLLAWNDRPADSKPSSVEMPRPLASSPSDSGMPTSRGASRPLATPARPAVEALAEAAPAIEVGSWYNAHWDGQVRFDSSGRLVIDAALRQRFDFILTGLGEQPLAALRQLLVQRLSGDYDPAQIAQVLAEFDLYTTFLQAADELIDLSGSDLAARFDAIRQLQIELLGDDRAGAWFGDQNADVARALAIRNGEFESGDPGSDPRASELRAATGHQFAVEMNRQYEGLAIEPAQRYAERETLYGPEAAERLAALDRERAAWADRLQRYADYRGSLMRDDRLSSEEIERALAAWRQAEFSDTEIRRVIALKQAGRRPPDP